MKTLDEKRKEHLRLIIRALRIIKRDHLARTRHEYLHEGKDRGLCACITQTGVNNQTTLQTRNHLREIVRKALKGNAYIDAVFQEMNPTLRVYSGDTEFVLRHKWVNQLIRDYTKMLKA